MQMHILPPYVRMPTGVLLFYSPRSVFLVRALYPFSLASTHSFTWRASSRYCSMPYADTVLGYRRRWRRQQRREANDGVGDSGG